MKNTVFSLLLFLIPFSVTSQIVTFYSPNQKIGVSLNEKSGLNKNEWSLEISYKIEEKYSIVIPYINLGLVRSDQDFSKDLKFLKASNPKIITENYQSIHGKRFNCSNTANEISISFEKPDKAKMNLIIRAYNDGVAFRYEFPDKEGNYKIIDELTSYLIPDSTKRWLEKFNPANEGLYTEMKDGNIQQDWCYPDCSNNLGKSCRYLIHESDVDRSYCGTKLGKL